MSSIFSDKKVIGILFFLGAINHSDHEHSKTHNVERRVKTQNGYTKDHPILWGEGGLIVFFRIIL